MRILATIFATFGVLVAGACGPSVIGGDNDNTSNDNTNQNNYIPPGCGNGELDQGEYCDDGDANSDTVANACRMNCTLARCGDSVVDSSEQCDGPDLDGMDCGDFGAPTGVLACNADCTFDDSDCTYCGNNVAQGTDPLDPGYETCDGTDFRGETCASLGHIWGDLSCVDCQLNEGACRDVPSVCGNGLAEDQEECDLLDMGTETCATLGEGFTGGDLSCDTANCVYDRSACAMCGNGVVEAGEVCDDGNTIDDLTCGADCTSACGPGGAVCNGGVSTYCEWDGSAVRVEPCDPIMGMTCDQTTGRCVGVCASGQLGHSYIGCDYYPTLTSNALVNQSVFHYAVAVSNSTQATANVTITRGSSNISTLTVGPGGIQIVHLPWVSALSAVSTTSLVTDGAYRLRSDQPVTVYQYNPLEYILGQSSFTNDAAILLPVNTWTGNYRVVSYNYWSWSGFSYPGLYAVTASQDNTSVTLTPSATGGSVSAGAGVSSGGTGTVILNAGDVLQVFGVPAGGVPDNSDLTGTLVTANKPVQVIGGHLCTDIPYGVRACDHIEESVLPIETLGDEYLVTVPLITASTAKAIIVRVIATQPNTTLTYSPPQAGAPTFIGSAGSYIQVGPLNANFLITASSDVLVAQYMQGQDAGGGIGDPAMAIAVPTRQYRSTYLFHAPTNYATNFVNITAPNGATVNLDGAPVGGFTAIGTTGFDFARVQLPNTNGGNHTVDSADLVGISVYGYGQYTSYWYPGGMNLKD
jgi:IgGFc binding protein